MSWVGVMYDWVSLVSTFRAYARPKLDRSRCPEEGASPVGMQNGTALTQIVTFKFTVTNVRRTIVIT